MVESLEAANQSVLLIPTVIILSAALVGLFFEYGVLGGFKWLSAKTSWHIDNVVFHALRGMLILWFMLFGVYLASLRLPPILNPYQRYLETVIQIIFLLSLMLVVIRLGTGFVQLYGGAGPGSVSSVSILTNIIKFVVIAIGLVFIVQSLGLSVTPALAALGVTSLAVSLALQEPLSSLFSGILMVASNQIRPGSYVQLSTGQEGYVTDINWRTTNIRQLTNNLIIVPNSVMSSATVINYDYPEPEMSVLINLGVSYNSDLEQVERVTREVGREVMQQVEGGVPEFEPIIRYNAFADYRIDFTTILRGKDFASQFLLKHEFVKRLHERYRSEGIIIPPPVRTIHTPHADHLAVQYLAAQNGQPASSSVDEGRLPLGEEASLPLRNDGASRE